MIGAELTKKRVRWREAHSHSPFWPEQRQYLKPLVKISCKTSSLFNSHMLFNYKYRVFPTHRKIFSEGGCLVFYSQQLMGLYI